MSRELILGQKWDDGVEGNTYWITFDLMKPRVQHSRGGMVLGSECRTVEELERVAADLKADIDAAVEEARNKLKS